MNKVVITGAEGQLGQSIQTIATKHKDLDFLFPSKKMLDITNERNVENYIGTHLPDFVVNTAAYTQVDKAEKEQQQAYEVNVVGVANLLRACEKYRVRLIQVSTDYVFDGEGELAKKENDVCSPINYYGKTKLQAEQLISQSKVQSVVLRTSWLFSEFGNNFVKTILHLSKEKKQLKVVDDQWGSPTFTVDLAEIIIELLQIFPSQKEIYHFANQGSCTWYEFAQKIVSLNKQSCEVLPIPTSEYPTLAKRPKYSVLNTSKIQESRGIQIRDWAEALKECVKKITK